VNLDHRCLLDTQFYFCSLVTLTAIGKNSYSLVQIITIPILFLFKSCFIQFRFVLIEKSSNFFHQFSVNVTFSVSSVYVLQTFVRYLVKQDDEEALKDAVEVARCYSKMPEHDVYALRINMLAENDRVIVTFICLSERAFLPQSVFVRDWFATTSYSTNRCDDILFSPNQCDDISFSTNQS